MRPKYDIDQLDALLKQLNTPGVSDEAYADLLELIRTYPQDDITALLEASLQRIGMSKPELQPETAGYWNGVAEYVLSSDKKIQRPINRMRFYRTVWFRSAAILLLIAGTVAFLYLNNRATKEIVQKQLILQPDIQPGGNKAILTLADGSTIILDSAANGNLASQGNTKILKLDGSLAYRAGNSGGEILYNTISTPNGGQYQIVLPDNSKVWLNAASSIRFPTSFANNRKVTITGEVYMEISTDVKKPFIVTAGETEVRVLGTSFNINAYQDEACITTTLLEGAVQIKANQQEQFLQPGQQAIVKQAIEIRRKVDVQQATAWKNGVFNFEGATVEQFMRQLARWYDLKIIYQGPIPKRTIQGELGRDLTLSQVMEVITQFNIKYKIEGKTLIIE